MNAKFCVPMSKSKDDLAKTQIHGGNINFDIGSKVKVIQRSLIYATHRPTCQTWCVYAKGQKMWPEHKVM